MIDVSHDNNAEEVESNRSSTLFERSKTDRLKKSDNKANNSKDYIRISTLKDLMRLFRINLVILFLIIWNRKITIPLSTVVRNT